MKKTIFAFATASTLIAAGVALADYGPDYFNGQHNSGKTTPASMNDRGGFIRVGGHQVQQSKPDIVDTAVAAGSFTTLVQAVQAAGLAETLKGEGPYTVFAPTDAAFAKLPAGTVEALLNDPDKLAQILKYHVVPGNLDSATVVGMTSLTTVEGSDLPVASIRISATDIVTSNGVIHVIDEVLIPQS